MTLGEKFRTLRRDSGLSQETIGSQGFVSAPGWIKLENSQRSPSEKLLEQLVAFLAKHKHIKASAAKGLLEELFTLKYLASSSAFLRSMAQAHARGMSNGAALLAKSPVTKPKRGRPKTRR